MKLPFTFFSPKPAGWVGGVCCLELCPKNVFLLCLPFVALETKNALLEKEAQLENFSFLKNFGLLENLDFLRKKLCFWKFLNFFKKN